MRINLQCPFSEKDQAKALGARWDAEKRVWYIVDPDELQPFERWLGKNALDKREHLPTKKKRRRSTRQTRFAGDTSGFVTVGAMYVETPHPDGLPPWEDEDPPELIRLVRDIGYQS